MYERDTAMLSKYDITVKNVKKVRGGWLCSCNEGLFLWKENNSKEDRLRLENLVCRKTRELGISDIWKCAAGKGDLCLDKIIANEEGNLLTIDDYGRQFVLREWVEGRECDVNNTDDLENGVRAAACMHHILKAAGNVIAREDAGETEKKRIFFEHEPYEKLWERRRREITRVIGYIEKRRNKNTFEQMFLKETPYYIEQIKEAIFCWNKIPQSNEKYICHGDYHYHNIVYGQNITWIRGTGKFCIDYQISDLYLFLRKTMEKLDWDYDLVMRLMEIYSGIYHISRDDLKRIYCMFLFPEKYWKQINFYSQSNKAWMPEKNVVKLNKLLKQEDKRIIFLKKLAAYTFQF